MRAYLVGRLVGRLGGFVRAGCAALAAGALIAVFGCGGGGGGSASPSGGSTATPVPSSSSGEPTIRSIEPTSGKVTANNVLKIRGENLDKLIGLPDPIRGDVGGTAFDQVFIGGDENGVFLQAYMAKGTQEKVGVPQQIHLSYKGKPLTYADPNNPPTFNFTE